MMIDKLLECPSAHYTWTTRDILDLTTHINENHGSEFLRDDWLTFSNRESAQFKSGTGKDRTIGDGESGDDSE